jgi:hypothetical protein
MSSKPMLTNLIPFFGMERTERELEQTPNYRDEAWRIK